MKTTTSLLLVTLMILAMLPAAALFSHAELVPPAVEVTADTTECEVGDSVSLSVSVTTEYEITGYRWSDGSDGATLSFTPDKAGSYTISCAVTVSFGEETAAVSGQVTITVTEPDVPSEQPLTPPTVSLPESASWVLGSQPPLTIKCSVSGLPEGGADVHCTWFSCGASGKDSIDADADPVGEGATLQPSFEAIGTYWFLCKVDVLAGGSSVSAFSAPIEVTVTEPEPTSETSEPAEDKVVKLEVLTEPTKKEYTEGDRLRTAGLTLRATTESGKTIDLRDSDDGISYSPTKLEDAGTQKITVSYEGITARFKVTVKEATSPAPVMPKITAHPVATDAAIGDGVLLRVTAEVSDGGTMSYQWYVSDTASKNDMVKIEGAVQPTYAPPQEVGEKYYCVGVKNTLGDRTGDQLLSDLVKVSFAPKVGTAAITLQPADVTRAPGGEAAVFTVEATGAAAYQWYLQKAGETEAVALTDGTEGAIGCTSANLSLPALPTLNGSRVYCVVTDDKGEAVTSADAYLTVTGGAPVDPADPTDPTKPGGPIDEKGTGVLLPILLSIGTVILGTAVTFIIIRKRRMM